MGKRSSALMALQSAQSLRTGCAKGIWSHESSKMLSGAEQRAAAKFKEVKRPDMKPETQKSMCIFMCIGIFHQFLVSAIRPLYQQTIISTIRPLAIRPLYQQERHQDRRCYSRYAFIFPDSFAAPTLTGTSSDLDKDAQQCATMAWI